MRRVVAFDFNQTASCFDANRLSNICGKINQRLGGEVTFVIFMGGGKPTQIAPYYQGTLIQAITDFDSYCPVDDSCLTREQFVNLHEKAPVVVVDDDNYIGETKLLHLRQILNHPLGYSQKKSQEFVHFTDGIDNNITEETDGKLADSVVSAFGIS